MTPTPAQIAEWRENFELNNPQNLHYFIEGALHTCRYTDRLTQSSWAGYIRARTEQATEIAELKAKLAELTSALKQYDGLIKHNYSGTQDAMSDLTYAAQNAHGVLVKLLKD
jgi:hypothetical protein